VRKSLLHYVDVVLVLAQKDFKVHYPNSVLGFLWSLLNPLAYMIILTLVFSCLLRVSVPNYAAWVLVVCLSCFSETNPSGQSTVWSIYEVIGGAGTTTITFLLTSPTPTSTGSIAAQLQDFIEKALSYHQMSGNAVLMGIEPGTEFGGSSPAQPSASRSWTLSSLVLRTSCDTLELLPLGSESVCSLVTFHTNSSILSVSPGTYEVCYPPSGYTFDSWNCSGGLSCKDSTDPTLVSVSGVGSIMLNPKTGSLSGSYSYTGTAPSLTDRYNAEAFFLGDYPGSSQHLPSKATAIVTVT
jgi:hypothetical protein